MQFTSSNNIESYFNMRILPLLALLLTAESVLAQQTQLDKPRLVVNIVISQMRADVLERYADNFSENGFARFQKEGVVCTQSRYEFMQTKTLPALATLTTGTNPSMHGIVSERWVDNTTNDTINLTADSQAVGLECNDGVGLVSQKNLTIPTLGDQLLSNSPKSKVISIALTANSAIVMGGFKAKTYWMDHTRGTWVSSSKYMDHLPLWVTKHNQEQQAKQYLAFKWYASIPAESYINSEFSILEQLKEEGRYTKKAAKESHNRKHISRDYDKLPLIPPSNTLTTDFAKQAIIYEDLGKDSHTDLLNICYDSPRIMGEIYGPESMEMEDVFYRLDKEIANLITFVTAQIPQDQVLFVLTSDHGTSDSYDRSANAGERFSAAKFKVLVNAFLSSQFSTGTWVTDYVDRQLYLNHNLIYANKLSVSDVQTRVAAFALQFRGVSHALTASAMQGSYFGDGYARLMQNGYYPKRSGDVLINLMPGWIEENEEKRAMSGSLYDYDRHVPLMWMGAGLSSHTIRSPVDMCSIAPTLAYIMQIGSPIGSSASTIEHISNQFEKK